MPNGTITIQKKLDSETSLRTGLAERALKEIYQKKSSYWKKMRTEKVLDLFHLCAKQVSAYKIFLLKKARIQEDKIKTFEDFQSVLPVNKDNYLRSYPHRKTLYCPSSLLRTISCISLQHQDQLVRPFYFPRKRSNGHAIIYLPPDVSEKLQYGH